MKRFFIILGLISIITCAKAQDNNNLSLAPTMGWSSWNTFGVNISEAIIKQQANAMVSKGLRNVGYDHINIDDGYFGGRDSQTGQLLIHPTRFPNGLKTVVNYIHNRNLKAGIYSDAGKNTCGSMFNGDVTGKGVGLYQHDQQDCDFFFKELGFDFIKVDFCGGSYGHNEDHLVLDEKERYSAIAQAIKNTGRTDVRMNACRWAYPGTWISDAAFSWRTTGDIYDGWNSVKGIIAENLYLSAYCSPGHYNDMDMLEVGRSMSVEEDKTHFGMWCIMNSPLLIGCNLTNIKSTALALLKNQELIALNQDTLYQQAYVAAFTNDCYIIVKDIEKLNGNKRAFAVYNPNDEQKTVNVKFDDIDLDGTVSLRDVFDKKDIGDFNTSFEVTLPQHGTRIYVAQASNRLERRLYEAETAFLSSYQELKNNQEEKTAIYNEDKSCSGGYKAGWIGYSEKNDIQWKDVYSKYGGSYKITIGFFSGESRNIIVSVNGSNVKTISANSGGWNKIGEQTLDIKLNKGYNTIRLSNPNAWMPDIDYIKVEQANDFQKENKAVTMSVDGKERAYWVYAPKNRKPGCPLVVAMHGASGTMNNNSPNFNSIADKEGFIVAYPQGLPIYFPVFGGTVTGWDASGDLNDDTKFIKELIDDVDTNFGPVDRQRIYCCGFSNGGMNTYALANTCSDVFAAFASISGFPLNEFHLKHTQTRPVPFLHIHGKNDDFVKYSLMPTIVDEMVARMGAKPVPVKTTVNGKYDKSVYEPTEGSFPFIYYEINGMGHSDFTNNTEDGSSSLTMWNFFKNYSLDNKADTTFRWLPRIETEGFNPNEHGWSTNSGKILLSFGLGAKTDANQNVYHSLQLSKGHYKLTFNSNGDEGKNINVRLQQFDPVKTLFNTSATVGEEATIYFDIEKEWAQHKIIFSRDNATDYINITDIKISTVTEEEITGVKSVINQHQTTQSHTYDISGRQVDITNNNQIYIQDGRKIILP